MGVDIYLRDRRKQTVMIDSFPKSVGLLRRLSKITELNEARLAQIAATNEAFRGKPAPPAAIVPNAFECRLSGSPDRLVQGYLVIGWDAERTEVTDYGWDDLPILGYAVRTDGTAELVLHEERGGLLHPLSFSRAIELGILSKTGKFHRPN
ncbi:hypothetical protein [Acidocella sp.]|uniref:hypothetical protein n=1 Tax=Acidocella sp. TaxID=50710 RepID=UPI0017C529AC|nr:hypothetical protein [Acidocella sp.]NNM56615.1 hypothetical protein [Acidocella sp.]